MSDFERLAEIEARNRAVPVALLSTTTFKDAGQVVYGIGYEWLEQHCKDVDWLITRVRELEADNARLQTLCDNLVDNGGKHAHKEARLRMRVAELEAQAEVAAAEKRHRRAASQIGIFESTDGGLTWHHVGDREEYDSSYRALVIARAAAEKGER